MCEEFYKLFEKLIYEKQKTKIFFKKGIKGKILLLRNKIVNKVRTNVFTNIQNYVSSLFRK